MGPARARLTIAASRQDGEIKSGPLDGAQIPQIPKWIGSAAFNVRVPIGGDNNVFFNANYQHASGGLNELTPPGTPLRQPAARGPYQSPIGTVSLLDLRAGVEVGPVTVALYAKNALQYRYIVFEQITTQRLNPRRQIGVDARFRF
jgi:hypothetical protein